MSTNLRQKLFGLAFALITLLSAGLVKAATITSTAAGGNWNAGATWVGGVVPAATDNVVIATTGAGVVTVNVNSTCVGVVINNGANLSMGATANRTLTINAGTGIGLQVLAGGTLSGTANPCTITTQASVLNNGTISATVLNVTMTTTAGLTIGGTGTGSIGTLTITGITVTNNSTWLRVATSLAGTGTLVQGANSSLNIGGTSAITGLTCTAAGNTVNYSGAAQTLHATATQTYHHLILSGSGAKTFPAAGANAVSAINGDFTVTGTATAAPTQAITIGGSVNITGGTFTNGAFTHNVGGDWTFSGGTYTQGTGTINFNGAVAAHTIGGTSTTTFNNLTLTPTAASNFTFNATTNICNVAGTFTVNANATVIPTATMVLNSAAAAGTITGAGTIQVTRVAAAPDYVSQYRFTTNTLTNMTVDYAGNGAQNINHAAGIGALRTSVAGTKTQTSNITAANGVTIGTGTTLANAALTLGVTAGGITNNGTFTPGAGAITITAGGYTNNAGSTFNPAAGAGTLSINAGNLTNNGTFTATNGTVTFGNAGAQQILGANLVTFNALNTNAGGLTLASTNNIAVNGALTFNGLLTTNANKVSINNGGSTAGANNTRHVVGNLERFIPVGATTATYDVGTGTNYLPINLAGITGVTTGGFLQANLILPAADNVNIDATAIIPAQTANRTWALTNTGGTLALTSFNATFNFLAGDVDGAPTNTATFIAGVYNGTSWFYPPTMGARTATSTTVNNLNMTNMGIFQCGNATPPSFGAPGTQPVPLTVCAGAAANFGASATGANVSYQWRLNGTNITNGGTISGATTTALAISSTVVGDAGNYDLVATNAGGTATSNAVALTVNTPPNITTQPTDATQCAGTTAAFNVVATGTGLTYQWRKGGVALTDGGNISGSTTSTLSIASIAQADAGSYDVIITGTCTPAVTSNAANLTVNDLPAITSNPTDATQCAGTNASFTVAATGAGLTYQWRKGGTNLTDGGSISGATTATLTITGVIAADAGSYDVVVSGTCTPAVTSTAANLTVNDLPAITSNPTDATQCAGTNASFTVAATGTGLTYQWRKGGTNLTDGGSISGATTATLTITGVVSADAGSYDVVVSGTCTPAVTSTAANLTVNDLPAITADPTATTVCTATTATFTVSATGTGITYQWRKGGVNLTDGGNISGSTTATLTISSASAGDQANYDVVVSGTCTPSVTSAAAALTVSGNTTISGDPTNLTQCTGTTATFNVTAVGAGLTYQWRKDGVNLTDGGNISGATTSSLSVATLATTDAGNYDVIVSGTCGAPVTSAAASLTINTPPAITADPSSVTLCQGSNATFNVTATGTTLTYQWQKGGVNLVDGANISGATTASLTVSNVTAADADNYTVIVSGACTPAVTSVVAVLSVNTPPAITTDVTAQTTCVGSNANFNVVATGTGLTYQWRKNGINLVDGGSISGATTATLTISNAALADAANYDVVISGVCTPSVTSAAGSLTVNTLPAITSNPTSLALCAGSNATFNVTATGTALTYQWRKDGVNLVDGGSIAGATTASLTVSAVSAADAGSYDVIVSGACAPSVTSTAATLSINSLPAITTQPSNFKTCEGTTATLNVVATGTGITYQWRKAGVNLVDGGSISGATTATLSIANLVYADAASYDVVVSGTCTPAVTSSPAIVAVDSIPAITSQPTNLALCTGNNANFSVVATGTSLTYQWRKDGVNLVDGGSISGATTANLTVSNLVAGDAGNYDVIVSGICAPTATSVAAALTIGAPPVIVTQPVGDAKCQGGTSVLTVSATGTALSYQWRKAGVNLVDGGNISGATTTSLTIANLSPTDAASYDILITNGCAVSATSNPVTVAVDATTVGGTVTGGGDVCLNGNSGTLTLTGATGSVTDWQSSDNNGNNWFSLSNTGNTQTYLNLNRTTMYRAVVKSGLCPVAFSTPDTVNVIQVAFNGSVTGSTAVCESNNNGVIALVNYNGVVASWESSTDGGTNWNTIANATYQQSYNNLAVSTLYRAKVTIGACPAIATPVAQVTVNPKPIASFTAASTAITLGDSVKFTNTSTISAGVITQNLWNFGDGGTALTLSPKYTFNVEGTFNVLLITYSEKGCLDTAAQKVTVTKDLTSVKTIANVISAEGDGSNAAWYVENIESYPNNSVTIVDRYGSEVFTAKPYKNDWTGTYEGKELPGGTYYYILKLDDKTVKKGAITILR